MSSQKQFLHVLLKFYPHMFGTLFFLLLFLYLPCVSHTCSLNLPCILNACSPCCSHSSHVHSFKFILYAFVLCEIVLNASSSLMLFPTAPHFITIPRQKPFSFILNNYVILRVFEISKLMWSSSCLE